MKHSVNVLPPLGWKICVGGGDGSAAWVLSELEKLNLKEYQPPLSIVPLGTGNDLSRALGWGTGFSLATGSLTTILKQVHHAKTVYLDRWHINSSVESDNIKVGVTKYTKVTLEKSDQFQKMAFSVLIRTSLYWPLGS